MLLRGINISNFQAGNVKISQLYIKLDKKLILKAKNIYLKSSKNNSDKFNPAILAGLSTKIYFLNLLFKQIELDTLKIGDKNILLSYDGSRLFVDTDTLRASLSLQKQDNEHIDFIDIKSLSLKDFDLNLKGTASIEALKERFKFNGEFKSYEISGKISAELHFSELKYKIYDTSASEIKEFMDAIELKAGLNHEIREWIDGNIKAKHYSLESLSARANLKSKNLYLNEIKARLKADNLSVKFNNSLPPATAKSVDIELKGGKLDFSLHEPKYQSHELSSSSLFIHDIFNNKAGLVLNIRTNAPFKDDIKSILKAYDINVPLFQNSGNLSTNLTIKMAFEPFNVVAFGEFEATKSELNIGKMSLTVKKARVSLNKNSTLLINAKGASLGFLEADIKADVDLRQDRANLNAQNLNLNIADIIILKDKQVSAALRFSDGLTKLEVPQYGVKLDTGKGLKIELNSKNVLEYFSLKDTLGIHDFKSIHVASDNLSSYEIRVNEAGFKLPLLLNGAAYDTASFDISLKNDKVNAKTSDGKLRLEYANNTANIWLNGLDVDAKELLNDKEKSNPSDKVMLKIIGKDSNLVTKNGTLEFSSYEIIKNGASINLNASPKYSGSIRLNKNATSWHLAASNLTAASVNSLGLKDSFDDGSFDLVASGSNEDHFKGELNAKNTYLKDYVFYQKLLSFIDTIPSLLSLKTPDFNEKGFKVNSGKVRFNKDGDELKFDAIYLSGTSSDLLGNGSINLKTDALNFTLELRFLKAVSNTIGQIPLLGHIILGKDRSLSTVIKVSGTTSEPTYETQVLTDTLLSPFKLIRNIISAPFNF
ncbi:hypothetical protein LBC_09980 [Campylobacter sp. 19-13652]|nr:hypothetical protein LBC_09980 [Campylobacter sp. 19-13652]